MTDKFVDGIVSKLYHAGENPDVKTITLDALKGAILSATDENGYAQELGQAIWNRL